MKRRFVEERFPLKEISLESSKEKSIRHGHISTLHIWWARRPLASSRTTTYASLVNLPSDNKGANSKSDFIINISKWKNSLNQGLLTKAQNDILKENGGIAPKILDPFSGGGAIPLEASKLGCETFACDYNPVAVLLLKCTLEFVQKNVNIKREQQLISNSRKNKMLEDIKKWSSWVCEEARKDIGKFYSTEKGLPIVGYLWARTIFCQNPSCKAEIPLMRQFWLTKNKNQGLVIHPKIKSKKIVFEIINTAHSSFPKDFNPSIGTTSKGISNCLVCGSSVDGKTTKKLFSKKLNGVRLIAIVLQNPKGGRKEYRLPTEDDISIFKQIETELKNKRKKLSQKLGIDPVPNDPISTPDNKEYTTGGLLYNFTPVVLYGMTKWCDLFNSRQLLSFVTFSEKMRAAYEKMLVEGYDKEYAKMVYTYLTLIRDRLLDYNSSLCVWAAPGEFIAHTFGRQALPMVWDFFEVNPFSGSTGSWKSGEKWILLVVDHLAHSNSSPAKVFLSSSTSLPFEDEFFDAIFTDPPYYDNVPYAALSDFFYVWLKKDLGDLYPELFSTPLTPKSNEVIAELPLLRGMGKEEAKKILPNIKTSSYFENTLKQSFKEIHRVLKPNGIAVIVYAHKSTEGWETLINSILESGLVVTAAWPINTEMKARLRAQESAALASSIYMVARKWKKDPIGFYRDVKNELKKYLKTKLDMLWNADVRGADFFISAIGSSIEVFGKYEKVVDDKDNLIKSSRLLEDIRKIVTDYAIKQVLHNGLSAEISQLTRFYLLWRWAYGNAKIPFDDALKLSQSVGIDIDQEWNKGFIKKEKEFVRILGPAERNIENFNDITELIDVLHKSVLLWRKNKKNEMNDLLNETGYRNSDVFRRVAQAISETLLPGVTEKKWLDGFLTGLGPGEPSNSVQAKLF